MGQATYYLKARLRTEEHAVALEREFQGLLNDLVVLNDDWQRLRKDTQRTCAERLAKLIAKHPLAGSLLEKHTCAYPPDLAMNCLAGPLPDMTSDYQLRRSGSVLLLSDYVWHFAEWDALVQWFKQRGAKARYLSDETVNYFHLL